MQLVWWGLGLLIAYLLLAPLAAVLVLWLLLRAGVVDWSGERRPAPADPLTVGYRGDPATALGWHFESIRYPTGLGDAEAWFIPGGPDEKLWAVFVHGIGGLRENGYRMLKPLHDAGLPVLMITYRNDRGAPRSPEGFYSFGLTEWPDLAASVDYAVANGAERVVIVAESMGAAITGQYLVHGHNVDRVAGLAFDAPALDIPALVRFGGRRRWVPLADYVASTALTLWSRLGPDLRDAVCIDAVARFTGPIFVAHGTGDPLVPFATTARLASLRPDIALWTSNSAEHPMSFETDRAGYLAAVHSWLERVRAGRSSD